MSADARLADRVLAIVGVGLLGGSVAAAAKQRGLARRVIGIGRHPDRLKAAVEAGLIDSFATDPARIEPDWNLVVVATPVDRISADARRIASVSRPGTVVTDVGSVKGPIVDSLRGKLPSGVEFVGSHPLAGSEKNGFEFASPDLFEGRVTVVTPDPESTPDAVRGIEWFWRMLGSRVVHMSAADHDEAVAVTSHVPHVVAAALAATLRSEQRDLAATGFRDTTRIAAGDPDLWVSILLANAAAVTTGLDGVSGWISEFRSAIQQRDAAGLQKLLQVAKRNRDALQAPTPTAH